MTRPEPIASDLYAKKLSVPVALLAACFTAGGAFEAGAQDATGFGGGITIEEEDRDGFLGTIGNLLFDHEGSGDTGGRGLLTTQGPTGTYLNPTSATMGKHDITFQYCTVNPNNTDSPVKGHGFLGAIGVTDWLEIGALASMNDFDQEVLPLQDDLWGVGPFFRVRLLEQDGNIPQLSVGAYSRFGDIEDYSVFLAAYRRFEVEGDGPIKAIGFHGGVRETWIGNGGDRSDQPVAYAAIEIELPFYFSLLGEVSTPDFDSGGGATPYGAGIQWRYGAINISASVLNNGAFDEPSFFWGIGPNISF